MFVAKILRYIIYRLLRGLEIHATAGSALALGALSVEGLVYNLVSLCLEGRHVTSGGLYACCKQGVTEHVGDVMIHFVVFFAA